MEGLPIKYVSKCVWGKKWLMQLPNHDSIYIYNVLSVVTFLWHLSKQAQSFLSGGFPGINLVAKTEFVRGLHVILVSPFWSYSGYDVYVEHEKPGYSCKHDSKSIQVFELSLSLTISATMFCTKKECSETRIWCLHAQHITRKTWSYQRTPRNCN